MACGERRCDHGRRFFGRPPAERRAAALDCFARYFGDRARSPQRYIDLSWAAERWTRGAYGAFTAPGVLVSLGAAAAEAVFVTNPARALSVDWRDGRGS